MSKVPNVHIKDSSKMMVRVTGKVEPSVFFSRGGSLLPFFVKVMEVVPFVQVRGAHLRVPSVK